MSKVARIAIELNLDDGNITGKMRMASGAVRDFKQSLNGTHRQLERIERGVNGFGASLRDLVLVVSNVRGALFTLHSVSTRWLNHIVQANAEMERLTALMKGFSTASTEAARAQEANSAVHWLRQMAKTAPYDIQTLTNAFVKFRAGGIDPTNGSLRALTDAVAAFGGSPEQFNRAAVAIQQMAGKGVISMEELRQQLGEAVPTAINLMARSMGLSMGELVKRISTGSVEAQSALAKMFDEMDRAFGGAAERMMVTFTGQVSLLATNLNELMTTNAGLVAFFNAVKQALADFNMFLADPIVSIWAQRLGEGMVQVMDAGRRLLSFLMDFRREIITVGQVMLAAFAARTVIGALGNLRTAIAGVTGATGVLRTATDAYLVNGARMATVLNSNSVAAYNAARAFGVAAAATHVLGRALWALTGPIGAVLTALWAVADALGIFSNNAEQAAQDIDDGIVSQRAVELVSDRVDSIKEELADLYEARQRILDSADEDGTVNFGLRRMLENIETDITRLEEQLGRFQVAVDKGATELTRRAAERLVQAGQMEIGQQLLDLQTAYNRSMEEWANRRREIDSDDVEAKKAIEEERLNIVRSHYEAELALMDRAIEQQRQKLDARNAEEREAARRLYNQLMEDRRLREQQMNAALETASRENVYVDMFGQDGLDSLEARIATVSGRLAELRAEAAGGQGELAKLDAQIAAGKFNVGDDEEKKEQLERLRDLTRQLDEQTAALKAQQMAQREHESAWNTISQAYERAIAGARAMREVLNSGGTQSDPSGLVNLSVRLEEARRKLIETSSEAQRAGERISKALAETAFASMGDEILRLRERTREIRLGLIDDENKRREMEFRSEMQHLDRMIALYERYGVDVKEFEEDLAAYRAARQEQLARDNETVVQQLSRSWLNMTKNLKEAGANWLQSFTDEIMRFVRTGKFEFASFAESVISDIIRIRVQAHMAEQASGLLDKAVGWIGDIIGGAIGGGGAGTAAGGIKGVRISPSGAVVRTNHSGGIVGLEHSGMRRVAASLFEKAKRYHDGGFPGLRTDEVPTILQKGEGVFTREQMKALGRLGANVTINVINRTGTQVEAEQGEMRFDGERYVLDVVMRAASRPGAFRETLKGAMA